MNKTVAIKLSSDEHDKFTSACKKTGVLRHHFAKVAILEKAETVNGDDQCENESKK